VYAESPGAVTVLGGLIVVAAVILQSTERQSNTVQVG
jgi:hypothetical protein